jgi:hypothetical protein
MPRLNFQKGTMPKLQRLELQVGQLECLYGLEHLPCLQQVILRIDQQAHGTIDTVDEIRNSARQNSNQPTVVVDNLL